MSGKAPARDAHRQRGADIASRAAAQPHHRAPAHTPNARTRTGNAFKRTTTATNARGETATRDLTVARDKNSDTVTRMTNYMPVGGREGAKCDVIQRTEDRYSRDVTRITPVCATHTRSVDVSCDKNVGKCVKQVEVGQEP